MGNGRIELEKQRKVTHPATRLAIEILSVLLCALITVLLLLRCLVAVTFVFDDNLWVWLWTNHVSFGPLDVWLGQRALDGFPKPF